MDFMQFVDQRETMGKWRNPSQEAFHIAFGVDENYVPPMGIMLTSMAMNNPKRNLHVHIFFNSMRMEDAEKLNRLVQLYANVRLDFYEVNPRVFAGFQVSKNYTIATYHRIMITKILYPRISKLLYIDADTLCIGPIDELEELSFDGSIFLAKPDSGTWLPNHKKRIKLGDDAPYFNVGVMYIDLGRWNQADVSDRMMELLSERHLPLQDQDALNLLVGDQIKPLPARFNCFCLMKEKCMNIPDDTVLIHFAGDVKPWQPWCDNPARMIYDEYRNKSLWKEFIYHPRSYQENRLMGKAMRKRGKVLTALKWYVRYIWEKWK